MFTFFECDTICLLYLLNLLFESVHMMKPATSKEGNSEIYVVCREFRGRKVAEPYLEQLYSISELKHYSNKFPIVGMMYKEATNLSSHSITLQLRSSIENSPCFRSVKSLLSSYLDFTTVLKCSQKNRYRLI